MKKRFGARRKRSGWARHWMSDETTSRQTRRRRTWTFEKLEDRHFLSATPLTGLEDLQWTTISSDTPEGQQLITALEQLWAMQATTATNQTGTVDATVRAAPTDPYFQHQWHLFNVGQVVNLGQFQDLFGLPGEDINVIPAWDSGITGQGVVVAVVDGGFQLSHPDMAGQFNLPFAYNALNDNASVTIGNPNPGPGAAHATAVAGLIAAAANNAIGGVGAAFGATVAPIKLLPTDFSDPPLTSEAIVRAIGANGAPIDIFNHSWGPDDSVRGVDGPDVNQLIALTNSALDGRGGLGAIHVWAAGNGAENYDSAGSDGYVNSRYTIGVGIVDHDGQRANSDGTSTGYGEMAPSVLVVAPTASGPTDIIFNFSTGSGIFTTDLTNGGINVPPLPNGVELDVDKFPDINYTTNFGGSSAAAPLAAAVAALMLEANPNLTYRDVEEILVRSARQNDDLDPSWIVNNVPLFRDPIQHNPLPPNYNNGGVYPTDEDQWNDEIIWAIVPGVVTTPATQATTGTIQVANGTYEITARPGGLIDGEAGNGVEIEFTFSPGAPNTVNSSFLPPPLGGPFGGILVQVMGNPTWGEIQAQVAATGNSQYVNMAVSDPNALFAATDEDTFTLSGGVAEGGEELTIGRAPGFEFYNPIANPFTQPIPASLFTNGAGYTVSHGRVPGNAQEYGYAHGVIDAALAVELAKQWHLKDQNLPPEKTWVAGAVGTVTIRGAEITNEESGEFVIPGALSNSPDSFADYFNEFFEEPDIIEGDPMAMPATMDSIDADTLPFRGDDPPVNTRGTSATFDVPAIDPVLGGSNLMSMEWVEVQLNITGSADAMNYLRITLVSPDGTHSELTQNHYMPEHILNRFQTIPVNLLVGFGDSITNVDEMGAQGDELDWVYSTNRHWGERSDSAPVIDANGNIVGTPQGWELHFENFSESDLSLNGLTVAFHGRPIGSPAGPVERIMGKVGVDSGRFVDELDQVVGANNGLFNFDRGFDVTQEPFAGNITVYAIDNITGQRVAEVLTGADGNFYFDLPNNDAQATTGAVAAQNSTFTVSARRNGAYHGAAGNNITVSFLIDPSVANAAAAYDPTTNNIQVSVHDTSVTWNSIDAAIEAIEGGIQFAATVSQPFATFATADQNIVATLTGGQDGTYTIGVEDPLGRTALASGPNYDSQWVVAIDTMDGLTRTAGVTHIDQMTGFEVVDQEYNNLNFLLDPGSVPADTVVFTGEVIGDLDGDGLQDPEDVGVFNFRVYADLNHTGQFETGEPSTLTNEDGTYELIVSTATPNTFSIGVKAPTGWTATFPASGFNHEYALPGEQVDGINFAFTPPTTPSGEGNGTIFGFVFNDRNGDGVKQAFEVGMPNITVFLDTDMNGDLDGGEISTTTSASGAYQFGEVGLGNKRIDVVVEEPFVLTAPPLGYRDVTLIAGQVSTGNNFGVQNLAINDFGDLVGDGFLTFGPDAARHFVVPGFSLGPSIDAEIRSRSLIPDPASPDPDNPDYIPDPDLHGVGDDQEISEASFDDEDGVVVLSGGGMLRPGNNTLLVTVNGVGGYFHGWIDVDNSGTFDAGEQFFTDEDLNPGAHQLLVVLPETLAAGGIAARFRWGTIGLDYFGPDIIGEVEDYVFNTDTEQVVLPIGDFNGDQMVDNLDYELWLATWGSTEDLRADANGNGIVDAADYTMWRDHRGHGVGGGGAGAAALVEASDEDSTSAAESFAVLAQELSYAAWQARNSSTSELTPAYLAWIESIGAEAATVNGPNGPTSRFSYSVPSRSIASPVPSSSLVSAPAAEATATVSELPNVDGAALVTPAVTNELVPIARLPMPRFTSMAHPATAFVEEYASAGNSSDANAKLRLVDQVLSEMAATRDDLEDETAAVIAREEEQHADKLALATVFDKEIDWRLGL